MAKLYMSPLSGRSACGANAIMTQMLIAIFDGQEIAPATQQKFKDYLLYLADHLPSADARASLDSVADLKTLAARVFKGYLPADLQVDSLRTPDALSALDMGRLFSDTAQHTVDFVFGEGQHPSLVLENDDWREVNVRLGLQAYLQIRDTRFFEPAVDAPAPEAVDINIIPSGNVEGVDAHYDLDVDSSNPAAARLAHAVVTTTSASTVSGQLSTFRNQDFVAARVEAPASPSRPQEFVSAPPVQTAVTASQPPVRPRGVSSSASSVASTSSTASTVSSVVAKVVADLAKVDVVSKRYEEAVKPQSRFSRVLRRSRSVSPAVTSELVDSDHALAVFWSALEQKERRTVSFAEAKQRAAQFTAQPPASETPMLSVLSKVAIDSLPEEQRAGISATS